MIFNITKDKLPKFVVLLVKRKGVTYKFSFIFCPRERKEDLVLKYPEKQFPVDGSIEIFICEKPAELENKDIHDVHISTGENWSPLEHFICHYPGEDHDEALKIAKFWATYNVRFLETGDTSIDSATILNFKLDDEITVIEIS
ncbi:MAG: hypothetical protein WCQ32_02770 [bacterium]